MIRFGISGLPPDGDDAGFLDDLVRRGHHAVEVGGSDRAFGTLGDIALIARTFPFVHPVVDWAHVHAMSGGALTTVDNFLGVFGFLRDNFPGWALDPLHCQFTDNEFGHTGEIRHVPYGQGTLRVTPLVEAAVEAGMRLTLISEARG